MRVATRTCRVAAFGTGIAQLAFLTAEQNRARLQTVLHGARELVEPHWFEQIANNAHLPRTAVELNIKLRGHEQEGEMGAQPTSFVQQVQTAHPGHANVADDEIVLDREECFEALCPVSCVVDAMARKPQSAAVHVGKGRLVLNDQNARWRLSFHPIGCVSPGPAIKAQRREIGHGYTNWQRRSMSYPTGTHHVVP
jgi:hypothetical protein